MLAKERQLYILTRLQQQGTVTIKTLCQEMNASKSTVQRDLNLLEDQGKISRERGGAVNLDFEATISDLTEGPVASKLHINADAKARIGKLAAADIEDGDLIFIDSGTTMLALVPFLRQKQIKIVTNSYLLLQQIRQLPCDIYLLGGKYSDKHQISYGPATVAQLETFRFDKAFISASGADSRLSEVYASEFEVGSIKQQAIQRSKHAFLLIDSEKFQLTGLNAFGHYGEFDKIITERYPDDLKPYKNIVEAP